MTHELRSLPSLDALKDQARRLRSRLVSEGDEVTHSKSLELIAAQYGFAIGTRCTGRRHRPAFNPWMLGRGQRPLSRPPFEAEVLSAQAIGAKPGRYRLTFKFDEPIDVVTFESFSAFRQRVTRHHR